MIRNIKNILCVCVFLIVFTCCFSAIAKGRLERCEPFKTQVVELLTKLDVSSDYYFLMVAESGCRQNAVSKKNAVGFWQLTKSTAAAFGCNDRNDLICSTTAAAMYIKHLEKTFHSFDDVIIAYNMGGHNYKKYGATNEAKGLLFTVKKLKKLYNLNRW